MTSKTHARLPALNALPSSASLLLRVMTIIIINIPQINQSIGTQTRTYSQRNKNAIEHPALLIIVLQENGDS